MDAYRGRPFTGVRSTMDDTVIDGGEATKGSSTGGDATQGTTPAENASQGTEPVRAFGRTEIGIRR